MVTVRTIYFKFKFFPTQCVDELRAVLTTNNIYVPKQNAGIFNRNEVACVLCEVRTEILCTVRVTTTNGGTQFPLAVVGLSFSLRKLYISSDTVTVPLFHSSRHPPKSTFLWTYLLLYPVFKLIFYLYHKDERGRKFQKFSLFRTWRYIGEEEVQLHSLFNFSTT